MYFPPSAHVSVLLIHQYNLKYTSSESLPGHHIKSNPIPNSPVMLYHLPLEFSSSHWVCYYIHLWKDSLKFSKLFEHTKCSGSLKVAWWFNKKASSRTYCRSVSLISFNSNISSLMWLNCQFQLYLFLSAFHPEGMKFLLLRLTKIVNQNWGAKLSHNPFLWPLNEVSHWVPLGQISFLLIKNTSPLSRVASQLRAIKGSKELPLREKDG